MLKTKVNWSPENPGPIHETIIQAIRETSGGIVQMETLGKLLVITKIPKGHGKVIKAWNSGVKQCRCVVHDPDVEKSLLKQKQTIKAKSAKKK